MKRGAATSRLGPELLCVRAPGSSVQDCSLAAQEEELRATSTGTVVKVVKDRGSGLGESRPGLNQVLAMASDSGMSVVRVTHEDRLARFGVGWLKRLFAVYGVAFDVLHSNRSGHRDELLEDFLSPATNFPGRLYSMSARTRLLAESGQCSGECAG
ncbi:recombinase family protein [Acrocarpospora sp. B8E8]|uniref:recombinase family protein n=1 Tax=Acrocarpospora sp. B8E8 TaxID=3153572 RepID=UPI00325FD4BD